MTKRRRESERPGSHAGAPWRSLIAIGAIVAAALGVAAWITGAYWFTSSTSFANPAVTLGRMLSDTFAGIRPVDAPLFVLAQIAGAAAAVLVDRKALGAPVAHERP